MKKKTTIERMDKVNKAVKAFLGKHLPPEMIATYHRAKAIELWKEQVMQAPSEGSLQQVSKLESDLKKASSIYTELSKPVWEQLETLKDKRATVRRQLEDLRVQESLLKRIFCDAKNTLSLHDQIKWKLLGSSKSEASEGHSVPLREIQEELNSVNMLIKRAQKHEIALTDKIKKGHDYLFYQAIELKANTHCFFAPQQMQEYRPEEEGRIRVTVDLLNSCAASTTAMVLSDIDSSYSEKAGREQIVKECRKEGMAFSTSWWANARDKRRNYNNPSREADIINRLQNAVTYTLGGISPYQKSLEYNGKKLGRVASLHRREGSNLPAAHSVVIDDIKLLEGKTYAFIRDPLINNLAYRIRWDDLEEVRDPMGFIPTALR